MSLQPYDDRGLIPSVRSWGLAVFDAVLYFGFQLYLQLIFNGYRMYYFLRDFAPILLRFKLRQLGISAVDNLTFLSWNEQQEVKRWLREHI
jgi:hypothetical protein